MGGRFGYTCLTASSGDEGIRLMDVESPDLVAYHTRETDRRAEEVRARIHLAKPFASVDFVGVVQRALAGAAAPRLRSGLSGFAAGH